MRKIIVPTNEADEGLSKLKADIGKLYHWGAKKYTKKVLVSGKRPKGVPKTKNFDGHQYKFYAIFEDRLDASEMSNMVRYHGSYARTQQYKHRWIVWVGENY